MLDVVGRIPVLLTKIKEFPMIANRLQIITLKLFEQSNSLSKPFMLIVERIAIDNKNFELKEYLIAMFDLDAFSLNLFQKVLDLKIYKILVHFILH